MPPMIHAVRSVAVVGAVSRLVNCDVSEPTLTSVALVLSLVRGVDHCVHGPMRHLVTPAGL